MPAVNLSLFKDPVFLSGTLIGGVMFAMLMSVTFLLPVFMQKLLGFTATQSGIALMPRSLVMMVVVPIVGRIYNQVHAAHRRRLRRRAASSISACQMSHYTLRRARARSSCRSSSRASASPACSCR